MNEDLPDPGGPCKRYPRRYGIPERQDKSLSIRAYTETEK